MNAGMDGFRKPTGQNPGRPSLRRYLATSDRPLPRAVRRLRRGVHSLSLPAPRLVVLPMLWVFLALRFSYHFAKRVFICEPLFKAYCKRYGRRLRTGTYIHWVQGKGDIIIGDNVRIDGKCVFTFAARFADRPVLEIGDHTGIGHDCIFVVGKRIAIGRHCAISGGALIFGSSGHPSDPAARLARQPPSVEEVREVVIGDGVWIGMRAIVFPGVRIGEGSIISAGSVVRTHVPPYAVVAGNPARVVFRLPRPGQASGPAKNSVPPVRAEDSPATRSGEQGTPAS
jgi:acetyltransferase-like isoleucine patch superfamily enzyme